MRYEEGERVYSLLDIVLELNRMLGPTSNPSNLEIKDCIRKIRERASNPDKRRVLDILEESLLEVGTSFSAAKVSAVLGCMLQENPYLSRSEAIQILEHSARYVAAGLGHGLIDSDAAIEQARTGGRKAVYHSICNLSSNELVHRLGDSNGTVRNVALGLLLERKPIEAFTIGLNDENAAIRKDVAWLLGKIGGEQSIRALIAALGNESSKEVASGALVQIGLPSVTYLIECLYNPNERYCIAAKRVLADIGWPAVNELLSALNRKDKIECDIIEVLGTMRSAYAVPSLIKCLNSDNANTRCWAAWALGRGSR